MTLSETTELRGNYARACDERNKLVAERQHSRARIQALEHELHAQRDTGSAEMVV